MKKVCSVLLIMGLLLSVATIPVQAAAGNPYSDISGHWAEQTIQSWSGYGIVQGYNGTFRPDDMVTRGETAVILDRLLRFQTAASNPFTDLGTAFYTDAVLKANAGGIMLGYNGMVWPEAGITRQDAFVMIARALRIPAVSGYAIRASDAEAVSDYAKAALGAMEALGMIKGPGDGKLHPLDLITRAELLQVLDNIVGEICSTAGTYSSDVSGYVIVNTPGVVMRDMTVTGTVVVAPGVGEGECTLDHVTVTGNVVLLGGGAHSIRFVGDSSVTGSIYIRKVDGEVRVYSEAGVQLPAVILEDGCDDVTLEGTFDSVTVSADVTVVLPSGTTIGNLTVNVPAAIQGSGTVMYATLSEAAAGTTFEMIPETTLAPQGTTVVIAGSIIVSDGSEIEQEQVQPSGGGGGGGGDTTITVSAVTVYLSDGTSVPAVLSGTTATVDLTSNSDSDAITSLRISTSTATTYHVGNDSIPTNQTVSVATMLAMRELDSPSVSLRRLRTFEQIEVPGTILGGGALKVKFLLGNAGFYNISLTGSTVTATLRNDDTFAAYKSASGADPVVMLVENLGNKTASAYVFTATKNSVTATRSYTYTQLSALTLDALIDDMDDTYVCTTLSDLTGITFELTDGVQTVYLIMQ